MKRSALKRGKPMRRKPPKRLKRPGSDPAYLARVRELECVAPIHERRGEELIVSLCDGPTEAHHAGRKGVGQKCHDHETIPLCSKHHRQITAHHGAFYGWTKAERRSWQDQQIAATQAKLGYRAEGQE